jgi:hypothetical protein
MDDIDRIVNNVLDLDEEPIKEPERPVVRFNDTGYLGYLQTDTGASEQGLGRVEPQFSTGSRYRMGIQLGVGSLYDFRKCPEVAQEAVNAIVSYYVGRDIAKDPQGVVAEVYLEHMTDSITIIVSSPKPAPGFNSYAEGQEISMIRPTRIAKEEIAMNLQHNVVHTYRSREEEA